MNDLSVYHPAVPDFLKPYLASEAMQRIKQIDMNCGLNYTSFPLFICVRPYSRYEHSSGTALIVWHFTHDRIQTLAALFHDIAVPVFSHVIDFYHGDHLKQEYTENLTEQVIRNDETIMYLLERDHISVSDISDYHMYPIADNDSPGLCADRLEYILSDSVDYHFCDISTVKDIYDDITVYQDELSFMHEDIALQFAKLSLACGRVYSSDIDRLSMETLAYLLRKAVNFDILSEDDFMKDEPYVIQRLLESSLRDEWNSFTKLHSLLKSDIEREGYIQVNAKKRYVDPLCTSGQRVTQFSDAYKKDIQLFVNETYDVWLKGVSDE